MSTIDTMLDWSDGIKSNGEALLECLVSLAMWCPDAAEQEAFAALHTITLAILKCEGEE